jgi:protoporphyrinogen oxidase
MKVAVIGSGMAGMAAADALVAGGAAVEVFEALPRWGGHTHSTERDGFVFDEGPHVSFTKDERVREVFGRGAGEVEEIRPRITNYFRGHWITHPAQCHLYGLDPDLVARCITDFVSAQLEPPEVKTYADWCVAMFGRTFAETFPFAYTRKYWTVEAADMSTDWVGARMYPPKIEDVVRGALLPEQEGDFHYLSGFRYPRRGGYQAFMSAFAHPELVRVGKCVVGIDLRRKQLAFGDGSVAAFDRLVSTMPLSNLVRTVRPDQIPGEVRAAAEDLLCSSLVLVNVTARRRDLFDHHWFYVYDEEICISRGHFPHMLSPNNAPPGYGSIQLEVYHSKHRPLPCAPAFLPERVVGELVEMGILRSRDEVLSAHTQEIPYANVVFDHRRSTALALILPWVREQGICLAGRYAEWAYYWTDDATRAGWSAAEEILGSS